MKYVALLRAINVGGHAVKMEELRKIFVALKFSNVETFINSGNLIFETKASPDRKLEVKIEKQLEAALGYEVGTFVRSIPEMQAIAKSEPFGKKSGLVLSVGFMHEPATQPVVEKYNSDVDEFHVHGNEVYWLCQIRTSDSKFPAKKFEKAVGGAITWRNMNTVQRIAMKCSI